MVVIGAPATVGAASNKPAVRVQADNSFRQREPSHLRGEGVRGGVAFTLGERVAAFAHRDVAASCALAAQTSGPHLA